MLSLLFLCDYRFVELGKEHQIHQRQVFSFSFPYVNMFVIYLITTTE